MQTYTFSRCIKLLDVDPKVFRRWVKDDLGLGEKDQVSRADSRVRYLTREQLEKLAALHDKILPTDGQADSEEKQRASSGAYKLLADRVAGVEKSIQGMQETLASFTKDLTNFEIEIGHLKGRFEDPHTGIYTRLDAFERRLALTEARMEPQLRSNNEQPAPSEQHIIEIETRYQQRITELEEQLATYKQQQKVASPKKKPPIRKKKKTTIKALPSTLAARNTFATLHNVSDKLVSKASIDGKIATVDGKWLSHGHVVTRALNDRGRHDFYQFFHLRADFKQCGQCPHNLGGEEVNNHP